VSFVRVDLSADEYAVPAAPPTTLGLLYPGKRHGLTGPPESLKSILSLILGLEHRRGGQGEFALLDFEQSEHEIRRLLGDLGATLEEIAAAYYVRPSAPPEPADIAALVAAGVTLVLIDAAAGAYACSGLDENKRQDAELFARAWIEPLRQLGIATLLLDHVVKNADNRGRYAIGSERKLGQLDVHLGVEVVRQLRRGHDGIIRILVHKDRIGHLPRPIAAELELRSDPHTHAITWTLTTADATTDTWRPTVLMQRVLDYLSAQNAPVARSTIESNVTGKAAYVRAAIDALEAEHLIEVVPESSPTKTPKSSRGSSRKYRLTTPVVPSRPESSPSKDDTSRPVVPPPQGGTTDRTTLEHDDNPAGFEVSSSSSSGAAR
jgi:AAA domain